MKYVYKIVAALGSLSVIPLAIFGQIFYYAFSSSALQLLYYFGKVTNNSSLTSKIGNADTIAQSISIYKLFDFFKGMHFGGTGTSTAWKTVRGPALAMVTIFVLLLVAAIVTAVFAIVAKDNRKVYYSSLCGLGLSLMFRDAFNGFAAPFLNGTITLSSIINKSWADMIAQAKILELTSVYWFVPAIFALVMVWTFLYNVTLPEEQKHDLRGVHKEEKTA